MELKDWLRKTVCFCLVTEVGKGRADRDVVMDSLFLPEVLCCHSIKL